VDQWVVNGKDWAKIAQYESHWIQLDWTVPVLVSRVVLDWGGAYSLNYELQIQSKPYQAWETIVKIPNPNMVQRHWGESEGAGSKFPLHRLHEIDVPFSKLATSMRLFIHESAFKNGYFYLWQIQAFGYESSLGDDGVVTPPFLFNKSPVLLTDLSDFIKVEASDAGESGLGIDNILTSKTDLDKDRWFVAPESTFGGLWILANFQSAVLLTKVVLDWCGECPLEYELQVGSQDDWTTLRRYPDIHNVKVEEFGRLPQMTNTVLHQIHAFKMPISTTSTRSLRVLILKPATKWGIALWQMRLYGHVV
jgi:hypothetical protein